MNKFTAIIDNRVKAVADEIRIFRAGFKAEWMLSENAARLIQRDAEGNKLFSVIRFKNGITNITVTIFGHQDEELPAEEVNAIREQLSTWKKTFLTAADSLGVIVAKQVVTI